MISAKELYLRELCTEYESLLNRYRDSDRDIRASLENLASRLRLYGIMADPDGKNNGAVGRWLKEHPMDE